MNLFRITCQLPNHIQYLTTWTWSMQSYPEVCRSLKLGNVRGFEQLILGPHWSTNQLYTYLNIAYLETSYQLLSDPLFTGFYSAKIDPDKECQDDEFKCTTSGECIPESKRCDGETADCKDYSDEYMCTCPDYIDEQKVCDSHVDCYDWGDEGKKCDYCKDHAYQGKTWYCHLSKQCIRKDQVI